MKTLGEIDKTKNDATGKASDVGRQLAFAGLAVVWILRESSGKPISDALLPAVVLLVVALALDLLQYVVCSFIWTVFYIHHDDIHKSDKTEVDIPSWVNWPAYWCFWPKIIAICIGWGYLGDAVIAKWGIFS